MVFTTAGGGATQETGYEIDNSYRIDDGSAAGMARFGNNSRNGNTFTISFWIKRTKLGEFQTIVTSKVEDSGVNAFLMTFQSDDTIKVQGQPASGTGAGASRDYIQTNALFRDPSAWYHIVYRQDTTLSTSTDRHRLYVNGVRQSTSTYAPLDQNVGDAYFYNGASYPYAIGNDERDNDYGNFYMAEHHYTDGVSNAPTEFGKTNENGVWIPKQYTGSHGSYGHYLKFENASGGSGTTTIGGHNYTTGSSSTIGADSSGNNNHFHVQGYSAEDNTTDTPTNNFCTMSPIDTNTQASLSEGNTQLQRGSNYAGCNGTFGVANGKWYWEIKTPTPTTSGENSSFGVSKVPHATIGNNYLGINTNSWAIIIDNADSDIYKIHNNSTSDYGVNASSNDIFQIALDMDNNKIYFGRNGTFLASGNPAGNSNEAYSSVSGDPFLLPAFSMNGDNTLQANFGNAPFSISSGNADANGYGNFEHAVPSGYYSLCTKNLAEFG